MIVYNNVRYTAKRPNMYRNDNYVYVVNNQEEVREHIGSINEFVGYEAQIIRYDKDEYIEFLTNENIELHNRLTKVEDVIAEIRSAICK